MSQREAGGSTAPSAQKAAKRAETDIVKELKKNYGALETKLTSLNNTTAELRSQVESLEQQLESLSGVQNLVNKLTADMVTLQEFSKVSLRLLTALTSSHTATALQSDLLASALGSGNIGAYKEILDQLVGPSTSGDADEGSDGAIVDAGDEPSEPSNNLAEQAARSRAFIVSQHFCIYRAIGLPIQCQDACAQSLFFLSGVKRYSKNYEQLHYPHGYTENDPEWPSFAGEMEDGQPLKKLRFDLEKPHTDEVNRAAFLRWCRYVRLRGAQRVPQAREALLLVSDQQIEQRCATKFGYEAGQYCSAMEGREIPGRPSSASEDSEDEDGNVIRTSRRRKSKKSKKSKKKKPTSVYRSRAEGVSCC